MVDLKYRFSKLMDALIFPCVGTCIYCGTEFNVNDYLGICKDCALDIQNLIMEPKIGSIEGIPFLTMYKYDGKIKNAVHNLKYCSGNWRGRFMARAMAEGIMESNFNYNAVTFVPMHKDKYKIRGYNQAKTIAEEIAIMSGCECLGCLKKVKNIESQTKFDQTKRKQNVKGAYKMQNNIEVDSILLVDDVITTGSTILECAKELRKAGAKNVYVAAYAKS